MMTRQHHRLHKCIAITKKGKPCPINADRYRSGNWYCHVHDQLGLFRINVIKNRQAIKNRRKKRKTRQSTVSRMKSNE